MGTAIVKFKIMPQSPQTNLDKITKNSKAIIAKYTKSDVNVEIEPIAFGLNALYLIFAIDESKSVDEIQDPIAKIKGVNSIEVADFRRAIG